MKLLSGRNVPVLATLILGGALVAAVACGGETEVVEKTVLVEKEVEKPVVQTVVVEKEVPGEKVIETVVVEKEVVVEGETVVQTVVVEREKVVEKEVVKTVEVVKEVTPTPPPEDSDEAPQGKLTAAISNVYFMNSTPFYCPACSVTAHTGSTETLLTIARDAQGQLTVEPMLAKSWEQSADGVSYTDLTLRKGVQFHDDWGEMTAKDVAFSWNQLNPNINEESVHDTGGSIGTILNEVEIIDDYTVRFHWKQFNGSTLPKYVTEFWEGISIFSKDFFDEVGEEGMQEKMIATGPFQMTEWIQKEGVTMTSVDDHWRKTPFVKDVEVLEVPEGSSRVAMLQTGQAQIVGDIPLKDWKSLFEEGLEPAPELKPNDSSFTFAGNYWAAELDDGTALEDSGEPGDKTHKPELVDEPWIGDPDGAGCDRSNLFGGTPPASEPCESMERARKVRAAMALAIDREALVNVLTDGLGRVSWAPGIDPNSPVHKDAWEIPFDPDAARDLLSEAGYSDGFEVQWWGGPNVATEDTIHEAICAMWLKELNISCKIDQQNYSSFRPNLVKRTNQKLLFSGGAVSEPATWPRDLEGTVLTRPGGYNRGIEIPVFRNTFLEMSTESDQARLEKLVQDMLDWNRHWLPWVGVYQTEGGPLYDPEKVGSWQMNPEGKGVFGGMNNLEWVQLK